MRRPRDLRLCCTCEHHGDGSQHGVVRIPVRDSTSLHEEVLVRPDARIRPEIDPDAPSAPSGPTMQVIDPYSNILLLAQRSDRPDLSGLRASS
jgi:hypothetical protein